MTLSAKIKRVRKALVALVPAAAIVWNVARPDQQISPEDAQAYQQLLDQWFIVTAAIAAPILVYLVPNDGTT